MHKVMIHPAAYDDCRTAVERAFELFPLPMEGKKILIKPNVLRAGRPEEAITTHPAVLRAVVERVESARPAEIVVGDNPGLFSYGDNERSFQAAGLVDAAKGYYRNIGNEAVPAPFNPEYSATVVVSKAVLDADIIISLPKFKTHGLTVITGAIKNSYGILPGAQKASIHRKAGSPARFHEVVVDVFRLRPPDLFIMDAIVGMQGNGPACTDLRYIGRIMASTNAVALDAVMARMMGLDPARLRFLEKARDEGLGDFDEAAIEIDGELLLLSDFRVPPLGGEAIAGSEQVRQLMIKRTTVRPVASPDLCTACGACIDQCPASALSMHGDRPEADPEKCIVCFCCQEICPEKAMALR